MANALSSKKRHEVTDAEIKGLNCTRESMVGKEMTRDKLKEVLKNLNYSTSDVFIKCITSGENPPIIRMSRGKYVFSPNPIYIDRLRKVWHDYHFYFYGRNRVDSCDKKQLELDISRAVTLLKSQGYRILKPITRYEEIL